MKRIIFLLSISLALSACDKTDPINDPFNELVGTWQLTEVLADPGDGSGVYRPFSSQKMITFAADGTYTSTGLLCSLNPSDETRTGGTYNLEDSSLIATNCHFGASEEAVPIPFEIRDGALFLSFPCIEPCGEKYQKITAFD